MSTRIYQVTDTAAGEGDPSTHLVRATSQSQAVAHVARKQYRVAAAKADDVALHMGRGGQVEDAKAEASQG